MAQIFVNDARTTLVTSLSPSALVIQVVDTSSFPTLTGADFTLVTLEQNGQIEIVKLIAPGKSTNTLIIDPAGRGWEGTTPLSFGVGSRCEGRITAGTMDTIYSTTSSLVAAEASTRLANDNTLQNNINSEAITRSIADTNEANARIAADALKAPLASPALTGTPTAPTPTFGDNTTLLATTQFVQSAVSPVSSALGTETTNRINADNILTASIAASGNAFVGMVAYCPLGTVPTGWLECDGSTVASAGIYNNLYLFLGNTFGGVPGSSFQLPDLRGEFIRSWDHGRGVDTGRGIHTWQADDFRSHYHTVSGISPTNNTYGTGVGTAYDGAGSVATGNTGGAETRPRNIALMTVIKY